MWRLSGIPLLGSGSDLQVEGLPVSGSETVPEALESPLEHQGLKMASPTDTPEDVKLSEAQAVEKEEKPAHPSLKSQQSTVSQAANVKAVTLRVYTMKGGKGFEISFASGRLTTAEQIVDKMLDRLGLDKENKNVFSVWLTSRHLQLQLKSYHLPCKLFKRWKDLLSQYTTCSYDEALQDEPILSFQRNAFLPLHDERKLLKDHPKAIDLLYHEAVFNVTKARYPMSKEELHTLAGFQAAILQAEGRGTAATATSSVKQDLNRFYPVYMLAEAADSKPKKSGRLFKQKSVEAKQPTLQEEFEKSLEEAEKKLEKTDVYQLKVLYLQICWHKPFYGSVMFVGYTKKPFKPIHLLTNSEKLVTMAVNMECVHLFSSTMPPDILLYLTYDQLSWYFEEASEGGDIFQSCLWVEFDSVIDEGKSETKVAKRLQIFSKQAPMMDAMITRCVNDINQKEEELRQKRLEQGNTEYLPEVSITSEGGVRQRQEKNYKEHKLHCEVFTPEGAPVTTGFTLSKVWKKKKSKSSSTPANGDHQNGTGAAATAAGGGGAEGDVGGAEGEGGLPMTQLISDQHSKPTVQASA